MKKIECLSNNTLKLIACVSMFLDHLGYIVFPELVILRILGRFAFPIFAYMLVEGCFFTHNKKKHFYMIFIFGVVMQIFLYLFTGITKFSIFLVFSASILLIYIIDAFLKALKQRDESKVFAYSFIFVTFSLLLCILEMKTLVFFDNYSLFGIFIPVVMYIFRVTLKQNYKLAMILSLMGGALLYCLYMQVYFMWFIMLAIPLLLLYNGKRGKYNMKYFFYVFYPAHFIFIEFLALII